MLCMYSIYHYVACPTRIEYALMHWTLHQYDTSHLYHYARHLCKFQTHWKLTCTIYTGNAQRKKSSKLKGPKGFQKLGHGGVFFRKYVSRWWKLDLANHAAGHWAEKQTWKATRNNARWCGEIWMWILWIQSKIEAPPDHTHTSHPWGYKISLQSLQLQSY